MNIKEKKKLVWVFLIFLLAAFYKDCTSGSLQEDGLIQRNVYAGEEREVSLVLDAEGVLEDYTYELTLEPANVTQEEAEGYFQQAIEELTSDFRQYDETLPIKKTYCDEAVKAEWEFSNREYVNAQGEILQEQIPEEGIVCVVEVTLSCGAYEKIYSFPLEIEKKEVSQQEQLLQDLEQWINVQMQKEGETMLQLPLELNGVKLEWSEERSSLTLQVLILEVVAVAVLWWGRKKQKEQEEKARIHAVELGYSDVVNQLSMLLETGMTTRQAWSKIAALYETKRKKQMVEKDQTLEAVVCMKRRLLEGESERIVYEKFDEEVNVRCYHQLMRVLIRHLDKGESGLCEYLEEECRQAYNRRILMAKKMGEEASTKMLMPLMLMMGLVMAVVLLPAIMEITV